MPLPAVEDGVSKTASMHSRRGGTRCQERKALVSAPQPVLFVVQDDVGLDPKIGLVRPPLCVEETRIGVSTSSIHQPILLSIRTGSRIHCQARCPGTLVFQAAIHSLVGVDACHRHPVPDAG